MSEKGIVIRTQDLCKRFKTITAVDNVNFEVQRGEVFGFLGPNGAGKTTTIAMLVGLVHPTAGSAELLGHDIRRDLSATLRRVGAMVENPAFYPYLSGEDNLRLLARILGDDAESRILAVLERVGLRGREKDKVGTYSLGMRQRLGLGSALLGDPELFLLDEPTNGLDPAGMQEMRFFIRQLAEQEGKTVFLSSHLLHEVEQVCDRVLILNKGQVIAQGRVDELLGQAHAVELRIGDVTRAASILSDLAMVESVQQNDDWLRVQAAPENAPDLLKALASQGLYPYEVRPVVSSLESVFLGLTDENQEESDA